MGKNSRLSKVLAPPLRLQFSEGKNDFGLDNEQR